jgi:hypothetical protein
MAKVLPPPILVVRAQRPARRWRWAFAVALLWLASLAGALVLQNWLVGVGEHLSAASAQKDHDAQLQKVAIAERAEQVARAANADLQQSLRDRQEEIAGLRADPRSTASSPMAAASPKAWPCTACAWRPAPRRASTISR